MLLLDVTHTSHTRAQTGIQRVVRSLFATLDPAGGVQPVCCDPWLGAWRRLTRAERAKLSVSDTASLSRGAKWSWFRRLAGRTRRLAGRLPPTPVGDALVCPELFSPDVAARLPAIFACVRGPRVAVFHDAIALRFPELTPPATVARVPAYLRELLAFDGIAAVSAESAATLRDYWTWLGVATPPPIAAIPLGVAPRPAGPAAPAAGPAGPPSVLCVATVEGRKNHVALLEAAESLWRDGLAFELHLIGLPRTDTAGAALARIAALQAAGRPLRYDGPASDQALEAAYRRCAFTVYPSLAEGFGLPVLESLRHGRPCVCPGHGALGESARGGGCLVLDDTGAATVADGMRRMLTDPALRSRLGAEALARRLRTWAEYAADLTAWMATLPRRA